MRKLLLLLLLSMPLSCWAQWTNVTATVLDPHGNLYANCRYSVSWIAPAGSTVAPHFSGTPEGSPFQVEYAGQACDSFGVLSKRLPANTSILPASSHWKFFICSYDGRTCFTSTQTVTGASIDLTYTIQVDAANLAPATVVNIVGGSINNTVIGDTIPAAATVTTLNTWDRNGATYAGDWCAKATSCLIDAAASDNKVCDMRGLSGSQACAANLEITAAMSGTTLYMDSNVQVQGQLLIDAGVNRFTTQADGTTAGDSSCTQVGALFAYGGADYTLKLTGSTTGTWTRRLKFINIGFFSTNTSTPGAIYGGPQVEFVDMYNPRACIPNASSGASMDLYGGSNSATMWSAFLHLYSPYFTGGLKGIINRGTGGSGWNNVRIFGGSIYAKGAATVGSICLDQQSGMLQPYGTDVQNCESGGRIMNSSTTWSNLWPDGCCVTYSITFDGAAAQYNHVITANPQLARSINGASDNTVTGAQSTNYDGIFLDGNVRRHYYTDAAFNTYFSAGKTAEQITNWYWQTYLGESQFLWEKNASANFTWYSYNNGLPCTRIAMSSTQSGGSANDNLLLDGCGTGSVAFNYDNGSGGVKFYDGAMGLVGSINSAGKATLDGGFDTGTLTTGTAPLITSSITPIANAVVAKHPLVQFCGTTTTCAHTAQTGVQMVYGQATLSSATPSTAVITGISPAFTSTATYQCTVTNLTTQTNSLKVAYTSASSITITGPDTVTDNVAYICIGT